MAFTFSPPNQLTFLRIILTPVFLTFLLSSDVTLRQVSLLIFAIALATDWYDGWVARRWGYVTRWGTFLDPLADKIITSAALIAFIYLELAPPWTVWVIVIRDLLITFLRSYAEFKATPIDTTRFAKTKTFTQFIVIFYVLLLYIAKDTEYFRSRVGGIIDGLLDYSILYSLMTVIAVLTFWTGILYIIDNWKIIRQLYDFSSRVTESE